MELCFHGISVEDGKCRLLVSKTESLGRLWEDVEDPDERIYVTIAKRDLKPWEQALVTAKKNFPKKRNIVRASNGLWGLPVDNFLAKCVFKALKESGKGWETPPYWEWRGSLGPHITVKSANIPFNGCDGSCKQKLEFKVSGFQVVYPPKWPNVAQAAILTIESADIENYREKHGIRELHAPHFTFAIIRGNSVTKIANDGCQDRILVEVSPKGTWVLKLDPKRFEPAYEEWVRQHPEESWTKPPKWEGSNNIAPLVLKKAKLAASTLDENARVFIQFSGIEVLKEGVALNVDIHPGLQEFYRLHGLKCPKKLLLALAAKRSMEAAIASSSQ